MTNRNKTEEISTIQASSGDFLAMPKLRPRLRVGVFADSRLQPRPIVEAFSRIALSDFAEIVLIATDSQDAPIDPWLWRVYRRLDHWAFATQAELSEPVDLIARLGYARILAIPEDIGDRPSVNIWQDKISRLGLDVAFSLGNIEHSLIEDIARYGIWRFSFGAGQHQGSDTLVGLEGFREVARGTQVTTSCLIARLAGDLEKVLYQSSTLTSPLSITRNRELVLRRAAQFPGRVLKELHRTAGATLAPSFLPHDPAPFFELKLTSSLLNISQRALRRALQKLFYADPWFIEQWFIAYRFATGNITPPHAPGTLTCLIPPKDRLWADPFPLERDGRHFIFFEELVWSEGKAHISVIEVDRDGYCSKAHRVLERPYHLSYPFLIEEDGQLFMIPESGQNGSVDLYRCLHFPDRWALEKILLQAPCCVDATFHRSNDKWWMFVSTGVDDTEAHDELHLYYADHLGGEWQAHCMNPIKSDVSSARSAGRLYEQDGKLYRPAQIGVPVYGAGISINQILKLSTEAFAEQEIGRIMPPRTDKFIGVHTVNRAGHLSVVDGLFRRSRLWPDRHDTFTPEYVAASHYS
jgi:hypothetical protein